MMDKALYYPGSDKVQALVATIEKYGVTVDSICRMDAISRRVFDCGHCEKFGQCPETLHLDPPMIRAAEAWWPCEEYQERKGVE